MTKSVNLEGIFSPIATPFNDDESFAWDKLQDNIGRWNKTDLKGYLVQGSNGEYCFLTLEERVQMVKEVCKLSKEKIILAGSGCESTAQTIQLSKDMAQAGADALVVINPSYFKANMNPASLKQHFISVADNSPVPIILYNMPANTGIDMPVGLITDLAKHDNIIGMKESNGDVAKIGRVVHETKDQDFQVLAGSAGFLLPSLSVGAVGAVCALANVLPEKVVRIYDHYKSGDFKQATALQQTLIAANSGVTKEFGVPGLKSAMNWFGYYGGPCRKPLLPLTKEQENTLRKYFSREKFL